MNRIVGMVLGAIVLGGAGFAVYQSQSTMGPAPSGKKPKPAKTADGVDKVTKEERAEYIKAHVSVSEVQIDPDTKVDTEGKTVEVPGLLRVSGEVTNSGPKMIDDLTLAVYPKDEAGEVLASFQENIGGARGIAPGKSRRFKFKIPDNKAFSGKFSQSVR